MEGSVYQYYANVRTEPVEWLWYPYIPLGKLTVLQGDPGEGKSTFALNVVARITTGQPMPDGVPVKGKRVAIYQCAEDGIADTIKPRLQQAGADCERVAYIIDNDIALTLEDGRIETAIKDTHASVFIIDPIQAFIPPDADMQSATKMRSVLRKLAKLNLRNEREIRAFHRNAIERRFGDFEDKSYSYISSWRESDREQWNRARWFNGMDAAQNADENKTIVCGHWHTSYGHRCLYSVQWKGKLSCDRGLTAWRSTGLNFAYPFITTL